MNSRSQPRFATDGAELYSAVISNRELTALSALVDTILIGRWGTRIFRHEALVRFIGSHSAVGCLAAALLGEAAQPVRAILFDKTPAANWAVGWHQDRTIAVRERRDVPGFGPWSVKAGVTHVEPPFELLAEMITLRVHVDECDAENGPLWIVPGSHRLGRVAAEQAASIVQNSDHAVCLAAAGDVWAYATPIIHASHRARMPRRRRVLQVDYAAASLPDGLGWLGVN
jgi:hypothetical protein